MKAGILGRGETVIKSLTFLIHNFCVIFLLFHNIEKCSFDSSHVYIWSKKRKAGKATELFHDQMFLLSVVPLNFDRRLAHMLKWLKLDFMQALVLVMNINVHFAAVKGRRDRLDSMAAYT